MKLRCAICGEEKLFETVKEIEAYFEHQRRHELGKENERRNPIEEIG